MNDKVVELESIHLLGLNTIIRFIIQKGITEFQILGLYCGSMTFVIFSEMPYINLLPWFKSEFHALNDKNEIRESWMKKISMMLRSRNAPNNAVFLLKKKKRMTKVLFFVVNKNCLLFLKMKCFIHFLWSWSYKKYNTHWSRRTNKFL